MIIEFMACVSLWATTLCPAEPEPTPTPVPTLIPAISATPEPTQAPTTPTPEPQLVPCDTTRVLTPTDERLTAVLNEAARRWNEEYWGCVAVTVGAVNPNLPVLTTIADDSSRDGVDAVYLADIVDPDFIDSPGFAVWWEGGPYFYGEVDIIIDPAYWGNQWTDELVLHEMGHLWFGDNVPGEPPIMHYATQYSGVPFG